MQITLVIPCYNEEANIQKGVLDNIGNFTEDRKDFLEVLIVDDGSSDKSREIITRKYLSKFKKFRLICNDHGGKAFAVKRGIEEAKAELVMFSDIDLATPIEEVDNLLLYTAANEVVIGSRGATRPGAPMIRKIMAISFIIIRNTIIGLYGIKDTQCGFKIFQTKAAQEIISKMLVFKRAQKTNGASVSATFDLEFLFLAKKLGYNIKEVKVLWRHMETKNVNFFKDASETLTDLARMKWYEMKGRY
jgi:dolichyl-phosphate beta-glucosyltransferase